MVNCQFPSLLKDMRRNKQITFKMLSVVIPYTPYSPLGWGMDVGEQMFSSKVQFQRGNSPY